MGEVEESIDELVSATRRYGESEEPWKEHYEEASACFWVETRIGHGVYLFDQLAAAEKILRERGVIDKDLADRLDKAWEWWLAPCQVAEAAIRRVEALHYHIEPAKAFRDRCARARVRVRTGARPGSWRAAVQDPNGKLFGKSALTKNDLRQKTGPYPE